MGECPVYNIDDACTVNKNCLFLRDGSCAIVIAPLIAEENLMMIPNLIQLANCPIKEVHLQKLKDNRKRRSAMGDRGGKKDKEKGQKQNVEKQKKEAKRNLDKQPAKKP